MKVFTYLDPSSLAEMFSVLVAHGREARVIAGGTDLIIQLKQERISPKYLISLAKIGDLGGMGPRVLTGLGRKPSNDHGQETSVECFSLGPLTTHRSIERSALVREKIPALGDAVDVLGSVQLRNIATIGGNICNAAPSADTAAPLLVHDAVLRLQTRDSDRLLPLKEFYVGPGRSVLREGEILGEILLPMGNPPLVSAYVKYSRRKAMDLPLIGVAVAYSMNEKMFQNVHIALSSGGPTPMRAEKAEKSVENEPVGDADALWARAGEIASAEASPRTSLRCTEEYRRHLIKGLVPQAASIVGARIYHCQGDKQ